MSSRKRKIQEEERPIKHERTAMTKTANSPNLDSCNEFDKMVYEACQRIPRGKVATYKEMARIIGRPKAYRAVGSALRKNPFAPGVPCHRVVASDLTLGGFYGSTDPTGELILKKIKMLEDEGVTFDCLKAQLKISPCSVYIFECIDI